MLPSHALPAAVDLGPRSPQAPVRVVLLLRYRNAAALQRFVDVDERRPGVRPMTRGRFLAEFAPTTAQEARVLAALRRKGFRILRTYANRTLVDAQAPSQTIERTFGTEIHDFRQTPYGVRYANVRPMHVPAALQDVAIVDASTVVRSRAVQKAADFPKVASPGNGGLETGTFAPRTTCRSSAALRAAAAQPTPTPNFGPDGGWGPAAVADGLCMPVDYGYDGTGETVGIVIDSTPNPGDIAEYLSKFEIARTGTTTVESVDAGVNSNVDALEATLDVETVSGLAPGANVVVYGMPDLSDQSIEDALNLALSDGRAHVVSASLSGCETNSTAYDAATDAIALQGAATGVTFAASSGDQGEYCYDGGNDFPSGVGAPASDPHFVGVGGTQSNRWSNGDSYCSQSWTPIANPEVWNDCHGASGGGVSTVWAPPPYQAGIVGASTSGRNVPDIALPATYADIYVNGWQLIGGTSWSSPMYAAMQAEIDQACTSPQSGSSELYGAFAKAPSEAFVDVVRGNNGTPYFGNSGTTYAATAGFDNVSGTGIPLGFQIAVMQCALTNPALRSYLGYGTSGLK
ncbi:MAG: S8 family serine peptidase [Candidatus Eremiobacteraeota bacterium]|nr:S8 family serine peptidase [Candidatus Eremiobacteraeota bacterium]